MIPEDILGKYKIRLAFLLLLPILASCGEVENTACRNYSPSDGSCRLSYFSVLANPGIYDGTFVSFVGYLGIDNYRPKIYPSREAYIFHDSASSIEVVGERGVIMGLNINDAGDYVLIAGNFSLKNDDNVPSILGSLEIIKAPIFLGPRVFDEGSRIITAPLD